MKRTYFFVGLLLLGLVALFASPTAVTLAPSGTQGVLSLSPYLTWNTYFGEVNMTFTDNAIDSEDNIIYVGKGFQGQLPTFDPLTGGYYNASLLGSDDGFIAKFDSLGRRLWVTYYGSSGGDHINAVAVAENDDIIVVGDGGGSGYPLVDPGNGAYFDNTRSAVDGLITRFNKFGQVVWSTYLGGSANDFITDIAMAENGHFWVVGYTFSNDFPTKNKAGAYNDNSLNNGRDWFVAKFGPEGNLLYSTYYGGGGGGQEGAFHVAYNSANGHVAISGNMSGVPPTYNPGNGAYFPSNNYQGLILEMDSTGQRVWATKFRPCALAFDSTGNLFIGTQWPYTYFASVPIVNPGGGALSQGYPSFVNTAGSGVHYFAKFDLNHVMVWGTCAHRSPNRNQSVSIYDIAIDHNQNLVAVGRASQGFRTEYSGSGYIQGREGGYDGTLAIFTNQGVQTYGTYLGGNGVNGAEDYLYTVAVNSKNEYLIGGVSRGRNCFSTNILTRNPGNAYYDGIGSTGSVGGLLPLITRFSPTSASGTNNECAEYSLNGSLPVEWQDISATRTSRNTVKINWSTASEINNHYFEIERWEEGERFQSIGQVLGDGDARNVQVYDFEDKNPKTGTQYYRIRQVDFDGTSSLSRAVEVYVPNQERVNLRQSTKQIKITSPSEIQQLEVWTIQGQMLSVIHPREKRYALSLRNLSKGVYIIHVQTSSQAVTHKIVIR